MEIPPTPLNKGGYYYIPPFLRGVRGDQTSSKKYCLSSSQSGLTIIECLIAILVVSILMAAIAPVVALAVATRVQSRRVELATQAVRAYIDGLKSRAIALPAHTASSSTARFTTSIATPTGSLTCLTSTTSYPYCSNTSTLSLYCIDLDIPNNGCSSSSFQDLVIQAYRTNNAQNYLLGLRVYRADGFNNNTALVASDVNNKRTQATFTSGIGDRSSPLVEMITEITPTSDQPKLADLCDRLGCGN